MQMTSGYGAALVGESGKDPAVRLGRKIDEFDIASTIKAVQEAAKAATQSQSDRIGRNEAVVLPAVTKLEQAIKDLEEHALSLSNDFRAMSGTSVQNAFKDLQVSLSMANGFDPSQYISIAVDNTQAQAIAPQAIRVVKIAQADQRVSSVTIQNSTPANITDVTSAMGLTGSFTINGAVINVAATDSLGDIIRSVNSANANVQASYLSDGGNFYLRLAHSELATVFTFADPDNILANNFGIDVTTPTSVQNLQAQVAIDFHNSTGTVETKTMYYNSNTVENLIAGTTITLKNITSGDSVYVGLSENANGVFDRVTVFFQQYNNIKEIINRNCLRDKNGDLLDKDATMGGSPLIQHLSTKLETLFSIASVNPGDNDYTSWKDLGIQKVFKGKDDFAVGTYTIDAAKLGKAIASNFNGVEKLFANYFTSSNSNFVVNNASNTNISNVIANKSITVTYAVNANGCVARLQCSGSNFTEDTGFFTLDNASQIVGPVGSVFEGITISAQQQLAVGVSVSFSIQASQGLAVGIKKGLSQILDKTTGEFQSEVERIKNQNESFQKQVDTAAEKARSIEKQWNVNTARLYMERMKYENFSKFLDNTYKAMNAQ